MQGHPDDAYEMIEGCDEENVGWMKVATDMVDIDFYEYIDPTE